MNRLIQVSTGSGTLAKYYYNAMNMRVQKHIDTDNDGLLDDKTNYIYYHQKVCVEQDENGNLKKDYVHGGQYIDQVVMESDSSTSLGSYYLTDLRYSVYAVVDDTGTVTERYRYDAYGKRDVMTATFILTGANTETEFGYTGRRHDKEDTDLMYFRARYYSAELGRFVGRDPLGYVDGMSLYRGYFVVVGMDPSGMTWGNGDALYHYYTGGGADVSLATTGHVDTVTSSVQPKMDEWKEKADEAAMDKIDSLTCSNTSDTAYQSKSVGVHSGVWWIGGISLRRTYNCDVSITCVDGEKCSYEYSCDLMYNMNDEFSGILDHDNSGDDPWDDWTLGGDPFGVYHQWDDSTSGSGGF